MTLGPNLHLSGVGYIKKDHLTSEFRK